MFQAKISTFKSKFNPSQVCTQSLKVFKFKCLLSKILLCVNLPYACLSTYSPLLIQLHKSKCIKNLEFDLS